jgi:hypothetical protein
MWCSREKFKALATGQASGESRAGLPFPSTDPMKFIFPSLGLLFEFAIVIVNAAHTPGSTPELTGCSTIPVNQYADGNGSIF